MTMLTGGHPIGALPIGFTRRRGAQLVLQNLVATKATAASLRRQVNAIRRATLGRTVTLARRPARVLLATKGETVTLTKRVGKILTAVRSLLARLNRREPLTLVATRSTVVTLQKRVGKILRVTQAWAATVIDQFVLGLVLMTGQASVATLRKRVDVTRLATVVLTASVTVQRAFVRLLAATQGLVVTLPRQVGAVRTVLLDGVGTLLRQAVIRLGAGAQGIPSLLTSAVVQLLIFASMATVGSLGRLPQKLLVAPSTTVATLRRFVDFTVRVVQHRHANIAIEAGRRVFAEATIELQPVLQKAVLGIQKVVIQPSMASLTKMTAKTFALSEGVLASLDRAYAKVFDVVIDTVDSLSHAVRTTVNGVTLLVVTFSSGVTLRLLTIMAVTALQASLTRMTTVLRVATQGLAATLRRQAALVIGAAQNTLSIMTLGGAFSLVVLVSSGVVASVASQVSATVRALLTPVSQVVKQVHIVLMDAQSTWVRFHYQMVKTVSATVATLTGPLSFVVGKLGRAVVVMQARLSHTQTRLLRVTEATVATVRKYVWTHLATILQGLMATFTAIRVFPLLLVASLGKTAALTKRVGKRLQVWYNAWPLVHRRMGKAIVFARTVLAQLRKRVLFHPTVGIILVPRFIKNFKVMMAALYAPLAQQSTLRRDVRAVRRAVVHRGVQLVKHIARVGPRVVAHCVALFNRRSPLKLEAIVTMNVNFTVRIIKLYRVTVSAVQVVVASLTTFFRPFNRTWGYVMDLVVKAAVKAGLRNYED